MNQPRTKQRTFEDADMHPGAFADEKLSFGRFVQYKQRSPHDYYYAYGRNAKRRTIRLGENNDTLVGQFTGHLTQENVQEFLDWLKSETTWHRTRLIPDTAKDTTIDDFDLPVFKINSIYVDSKFHRKMTETFKSDLSKIEAAKAKRLEKQKEETKKRQAEERARRKKAAEREKRETEKMKVNAEFGDLASALKVLKKHGLKIVTVEEKPETKKKPL